MKRKILVGFFVMVMALTMTVGTAFAAILEYDNAATTSWGKNGGDGIDEYKLKLQDEGVDPAVAATITEVVITFDIQTDLFKPQLVINSEKGGWNQKEVEFIEQGIITYTLPTNNKFTADSNWNELWIQSGWKNEGDVALLSIEFKDADGKVVYSVGDAAVEEDVVEVEDDAEEVVEEEVVVEEAKTEPTKAATKNVPKTGMIDLSLLYGLGAVVSGAIVLKRKQK